ncbi:MAG: hypothetical protein VB027_07645 [Gordonibacter sp.]|nr:hypothetical protein [Gordonibacter sp.]
MDDVIAIAAEVAADTSGYQITQQDVTNLTSLATTVSVELWVLIALLVLIAGLIFAAIATRFWRVG